VFQPKAGNFYIIDAMNVSRIRWTSLIRKHYALPSEHGSWIWWIGPLIIGAAAGGSRYSHLPLLAAAVLAVFLLRQPTAILVKVVSGRRSRREQLPAVLWMILYSAAGVIFASALVTLGHGRILGLAIPGFIVFAWHLYLISRRAERGQLGIELVGAGVLSLAAPAAYWITGGPDDCLAWILWGMTWLQAAASIVNVYFRLEYRRSSEAPPLMQRWQRGARNLAYHLFNLAVAVVLSTVNLLPWLFALGYGLMLVDALEGVLRPPVGERPTRIGVRQLISSFVFVVIAALSFWIPA
jgi:hypothetical protein